jgi:Mg-chelatase subunit ChlD
MREMARNLRPGDEAFLMAFSDELDFEQDLTENDELLEEGLANLHPKSGAALFEGMNFAIQHLKRIGKNGNRVLLIISDGRNVPNSNGVQHLDADLSRVRIDCIGLDVERAIDRENLQKLAYGSGGMTSFVNDPEQIRTAASAMARTIIGEGFANR